MAINFLGASASGTSNFTGICNVTIPISTNDTVIVVVKSDPSVVLIGPSDTGGTTYNSLGSFSAGSIAIDLFASAPGGAFASSSVSCSISPAFTDVVVVVARYSGVSALGASVLNGGTTANPSVTLSTTAANNFMLAAFVGSAAQADTSLTGILRQAFFLSGNTKDTASLVDISSGSPASLTAAVTNLANSWLAVAVEMFASGSASAVGTDDVWRQPAPQPADPNVTVW